MRRFHVNRAAPVCGALVALVMAMALCPAAQGGSTSARHFAVGWDNGLSLRAIVSRGWGVGIHYKHAGTSRIAQQEIAFPDQWNEYGLLVFGDYPLTDHISLGPFTELILARDDSPDFDTEAYGAIIGLRPSFHLLGDRFLLESRFGLQIVRTEDQPQFDEEYIQTGLQDSWTTTVAGQELGLNSRVTFMFLF